MTKLYLKLKNFWLDWGKWLIAIVLIVYLEILVQDNNTLLPICIPWMYDRFAMCVISILLAFIKKISGKSKEEFGSIFGGYCIKTALCFILAKTLCPQRHSSKVCFELLETFQVTLERTNELSS